MLNKIVILLLLAATCLTSFAHKINGYKYILIEESGNTLNIEEKLRDIFTEIGFTVLEEGDEDTLSVADKKIVLKVTYGYNIRYGMPSELEISLTNYTGQNVYNSKTMGNSLSASGDMTKALNKFKKNLQRLNYHFEEKRITPTKKYDVSCTEWGEDSIRSYFQTHDISNIEGIYKNFQNDGAFCRFAIVKEKEKFYGVVLESDNVIWNVGEVRLILDYIEDNLYDAEYYNTDKVKLNCVASYKDRILSIMTTNGSISYLKTYPSSTTTYPNQSNKTSISNKKHKYTATGSGFLIAGKVFATNYHVIEGAKNIEINLQTADGTSTYEARVLSTDKVNDLALLIIKDPNYKPIAFPPYYISSNIIDVGTSIFTMGYPMTDVLGKEIKITDGIVSSKTGFQDNISTYQISAPITHGNSGGPLFDHQGNLVGITSSGFTGADNTNYAIKATYLISLIESSPIEIDIKKERNAAHADLPTLIKSYKPYVALIGIY